MHDPQPCIFLYVYPEMLNQGLIQKNVPIFFSKRQAVEALNCDVRQDLL